MWRIRGILLTGLLVTIPGYSYAVDGAGLGWLEIIFAPLILPALLFSYIDTSSRSCDVYSYVRGGDEHYVFKCTSPNRSTADMKDTIFGVNARADGAASIEVENQKPQVFNDDLKMFESPNIPKLEIRSIGYPKP